MNFRCFLAACCLMHVSEACFAQDAIIFRDGRVKQVKIIQTNNDKTLYTEWGNKHAPEEFVDNVDVFMLKFKTRGNVVFNSRGERILTTSETMKLPKDTIVIYYKDGREVPAYGLIMDARTVSFRVEKKAKSRLLFSPKSDVFMIRYPDGTRDILTNLAVEEQREREFAAREAERIARENAAREDSIKAAAETETALSGAPRRATIVTKKGVRMKVWVCDDSGATVAYKR